MEIKKLEPADFERWNRFCADSAEAWFWHTAYAMEYIQNYNKGVIDIQNLSFYVEIEKEIVGICPIFLENHKGILKLIGGGTGLPGVMPAVSSSVSEQQKVKIRDMIFGYIDQLALENDVKVTILRIPALLTNIVNYNFLMEHQYLNTSLNSNIICLIEKIKFRKGHKHNINQAKKLFKLITVSQDNYNEALAQLYPELHFQAAGRRTRPLESFQNNIDWLKKGLAVLFLAEYQDKIIGFSLINYFKKAAYYTSAGTLPSYNDLPVGHFLQSYAIEWLQNHGIELYEIGLQNFSPQLYDFPSDKDLNISLFKRGFGGKNVSLFSGEKYYSKDYFLEVYQERVINFSKSLKSGIV